MPLGVVDLRRYVAGAARLPKSRARRLRHVQTKLGFSGHRQPNNNNASHFGLFLWQQLCVDMADEVINISSDDEDASGTGTKPIAVMDTDQDASGTNPIVVMDDSSDEDSASGPDESGASGASGATESTALTSAMQVKKESTSSNSDKDKKATQQDFYFPTTAKAAKKIIKQDVVDKTKSLFMYGTNHTITYMETATKTIQPEEKDMYHVNNTSVLFCAYCKNAFEQVCLQNVPEEAEWIEKFACVDCVRQNELMHAVACAQKRNKTTYATHKITGEQLIRLLGKERKAVAINTRRKQLQQQKTRELVKASTATTSTATTDTMISYNTHVTYQRNHKNEIYWRARIAIQALRAQTRFPFDFLENIAFVRQDEDGNIIWGHNDHTDKEFKLSHTYQVHMPRIHWVFELALHEIAAYLDQEGDICTGKHRLHVKFLAYLCIQRDIYNIVKIHNQLKLEQQISGIVQGIEQQISDEQDEAQQELLEQKLQEEQSKLDQYFWQQDLHLYILELPAIGSTGEAIDLSDILTYTQEEKKLARTTDDSKRHQLFERKQQMFEERKTKLTERLAQLRTAPVTTVNSEFALQSSLFLLSPLGEMYYPTQPPYVKVKPNGCPFPYNAQTWKKYGWLWWIAQYASKSFQDLFVSPTLYKEKEKITDENVFLYHKLYFAEFQNNKYFKFSIKKLFELTVQLTYVSQLELKKPEIPRLHKVVDLKKKIPHLPMIEAVKQLDLVSVYQSIANNDRVLILREQANHVIDIYEKLKTTSNGIKLEYYNPFDFTQLFTYGQYVFNAHFAQLLDKVATDLDDTDPGKSILKADDTDPGKSILKAVYDGLNQQIAKYQSERKQKQQDKVTQYVIEMIEKLNEMKMKEEGQDVFYECSTDENRQDTFIPFKEQDDELKALYDEVFVLQALGLHPYQNKHLIVNAEPEAQDNIKKIISEESHKYNLDQNDLEIYLYQNNARDIRDLYQDQRRLSRIDDLKKQQLRHKPALNKIQYIELKIWMELLLHKTSCANIIQCVIPLLELDCFIQWLPTAEMMKPDLNVNSAALTYMVNYMFTQLTHLCIQIFYAQCSLQKQKDDIPLDDPLKLSNSQILKVSTEQIEVEINTRKEKAYEVSLNLLHLIEHYATSSIFLNLFSVGNVTALKFDKKTRTFTVEEQKGGKVGEQGEEGKKGGVVESTGTESEEEEEEEGGVVESKGTESEEEEEGEEGGEKGEEVESKGTESKEEEELEVDTQIENIKVDDHFVIALSVKVKEQGEVEQQTESKEKEKEGPLYNTTLQYLQQQNSFTQYDMSIEKMISYCITKAGLDFAVSQTCNLCGLDIRLKEQLNEDDINLNKIVHKCKEQTQKQLELFVTKHESMKQFLHNVVNGKSILNYDTIQKCLLGTNKRFTTVDNPKLFTCTLNIENWQFAESEYSIKEDQAFPSISSAHFYPCVVLKLTVKKLTVKSKGTESEESESKEYFTIQPAMPFMYNLWSHRDFVFKTKRNTKLNSETDVTANSTLLEDNAKNFAFWYITAPLHVKESHLYWLQNCLPQRTDWLVPYNLRQLQTTMLLKNNIFVAACPWITKATELERTQAKRIAGGAQAKVHFSRNSGGGTGKLVAVRGKGKKRAAAEAVTLSSDSDEDVAPKSDAAAEAVTLSSNSDKDVAPKSDAAAEAVTLSSDSDEDVAPKSDAAVEAVTLSSDSDEDVAQESGTTSAHDQKGKKRGNDERAQLSLMMTQAKRTKKVAESAASSGGGAQAKVSLNRNRGGKAKRTKKVAESAASSSDSDEDVAPKRDASGSTTFAHDQRGKKRGNNKSAQQLLMMTQAKRTRHKQSLEHLFQQKLCLDHSLKF